MSPVQIKAKKRKGEGMISYNGKAIAAIDQGDVETFKKMIVSGGVNVSDKDGWTFLHYAASYGSVDCLRELIISGADVNAKDHKGRTPLHWAAIKMRQKCMKYLIESGAG